MKNEDKLIQEIGSHLDQSLEQIDQKTLYKISAARARALSGRSSGWRKLGIPLSGIATAAAVVIIAVQVMNNVEPVLQTKEIEVVEMLSSEQNLDFYENLEFYTWLAQNSEEDLGS